MKTIGQFQRDRAHERARSKEERLNRSRDKLSVIESMSPAVVNQDVLDITREQIRGGYGEWLGLACDKCQVELYRWDYSVYTSYPPKSKVHCPGCGTAYYTIDLPESQS